MAERLTVALEDGDVTRLRELAGGERKVGAYLHSVIEWLWFNRDALAGADIAQFAPMTPARQQEIERQMEQIETLMRSLEAAQRETDAQLQALRVDSASHAHVAKTADVQVSAGVSTPQ